MKTGLSNEEILRWAEWFEKDPRQIPEDIASIHRRLVMISIFVNNIVAKNRDLLQRLREYMGLAPKSEKGSQLTNQRRGFWRR